MVNHSTLAGLLAAILLCSGCTTFDYVTYSAEEFTGYESSLKKPADNSWQWVRGCLTEDIDLDNVDEEVALVTRQKGTRKTPGPILSAEIIVYRRNEKYEPVEVTRTALLPLGKEEHPSFPEEVWTNAPPAQWVGCKATNAKVDPSGPRMVNIALWSKPGKSGVIHVLHLGYLFDGKTLTRVFATRALQTTAAVEHVDLDNDTIRELIVVHAPVPPFDENWPRPRWMTIFKRNAQGQWHYDDTVVTRRLRRNLLLWFENYAAALNAQAKPEVLARYEYYIGIAFLRLEKNDRATYYLKRARQHASTDALRRAADIALKRLSQQP